MINAPTSSRLTGHCLLLLLVTITVQAFGQSTEETFLKGNIAYGNGHFEEATTAYREVLKTVQSAEVHYNLGNSLAQLNQWSEAAFHYMRAYSLNPNLESAQKNLLLAANRMGLADEYPKLSSPGNLLSERQWTTLAAALFWVALIFFFHGNFVRFRIPFNKTIGSIAALIMVISIVSIIQHKLFKEWAVVASPLVSLRVAPTDQSPGESVLIEGDPIRIIGEQKGFFRVMTHSGAEGYILEKEVFSIGND